MIIAAALLVLALVYAFWPRPVPVDIGAVVIEPMMETVTEEGRTRVHDAYIVSTPVAGRLRRVDVEPGDAVERGVSLPVATPVQSETVCFATRGWYWANATEFGERCF